MPVAPRGGQALASEGVIPDTAVQGVRAAKPGAGACLGAVLLVERHHPASGSSRSSPGVAASGVHVITSLQPPEVCGCPGWHRTPLCIIASISPALVAPVSPHVWVWGSRGAPGPTGGCTARADYCSGAAGNIGMPLHPAELPKASPSCIRDLSSNNKGNGQEIRDK